MMGSPYAAVLRLWEQQITRAEIARRLNLSEKKVLKILVAVKIRECRKKGGDSK